METHQWYPFLSSVWIITNTFDLKWKYIHGKAGQIFTLILFGSTQNSCLQVTHNRSNWNWTLGRHYGVKFGKRNDFHVLSNVSQLSVRIYSSNSCVSLAWGDVFSQLSVGVTLTIKNTLQKEIYIWNLFQLWMAPCRHHGTHTLSQLVWFCTLSDTQTGELCADNHHKAVGGFPSETNVFGAQILSWL